MNKLFPNKNKTSATGGIKKNMSTHSLFYLGMDEKLRLYLHYKSKVLFPSNRWMQFVFEGEKLHNFPAPHGKLKQSERTDHRMYA